MAKPSPRLGNVIAAWLVLAGIVLLVVGLFAVRDYQAVVTSDPLPPKHWTTRLPAPTSADEPDELETRYSRPAPAMHAPVPSDATAELMK